MPPKRKKLSARQWHFEKEPAPHDELADANTATPMSARNVPSEQDVARAAQRAALSRRPATASLHTRQYRVAKRDQAKLGAFSALLTTLGQSKRRKADEEKTREVDDDDDDQPESDAAADDDAADDDDADEVDDVDDDDDEEADAAADDDDDDVAVSTRAAKQLANRTYVEDGNDSEGNYDDDGEGGNDDNDDGEGGEDAAEGDAFVEHFFVSDVEPPSKEEAAVRFRFRAVATPASESALLIESAGAAPTTLTPLPLGTSFRESLALHKRVARELADETPTREQLDLAQLIAGYRDVLFTGRTAENAKALRTVVCAHAVNHIVKTRDTMAQNNARLARDDTLEVRDGSFARPRVLFVVPHRRHAFEVALELARLYPASKIHNQGRLEDDYGDDTDSQQTGFFPARKSADFREAFRGNTDDNFRLGVRLEPRGIRFFSDFYMSDVIIASPLGMRLLFEQTEAERAVNRKLKTAGASDVTKKADLNRKGDTDFLTSIEVCVVLHTDLLLMQNWEHTTLLLSKLNRMPRETRDTDFSRVHLWYLEKHAKLLRQTILLGSVLDAHLNSALKFYCHNVAGTWRARLRCTGGAVRGVVPRVRQLLHRVDVPVVDLAEQAKARFEYFRETLLPSLMLEGGRGGVVIYFASYFDYVRVRNLFKTRRLSYLQCCEYTDDSNVVRARRKFGDGDVEFMLYTERFHFYHRYKLRGTRSIVLYGLPTFPAFYTELLNWLADGDTVLVIYTAADRLALERCVGAERAKALFAAVKNVHMLV